MTEQERQAAADLAQAMRSDAERILVSEGETSQIIGLMPMGYCASFAFSPGAVWLKYDESPLGLYALGFLRGVISREEMDAKMMKVINSTNL